jgi:rhodanese-related sulfurtransferase
VTSGKFVTTIGYERLYNSALQFTNKDSFIEFMVHDQPARPANILNIVAINQGKRLLTMDPPRVAMLPPKQVKAMLDGDEQIIVIDTRSEAAFGAGHIPGAYNIQLSSSEFEQRVGWVTPLDVPIILLLDHDSQADEAAFKLAFLGLDQRVKGYLASGLKGWLNEGYETTTVPQISVHQLQEHLTNGLPMQVLDVRETSEWDDGHIAGANYMSYKTLRQNIDELDLSEDDHVSVLCARGLRSSTACSILKMNGYKNIYNVTGGMSAWASAGLPMVDNEGNPAGARADMPEWFEQ